jgi:WD40 repeat protein
VISPDGATAALLLGGPPGTIAVELIDLATGHRRHVDLSLDDEVLDAAMVWSPDGRWLFTIGAGGTLRAIDRRTGGARSLGVSLPELRQLALRNRLR